MVCGVMIGTLPKVALPIKTPAVPPEIEHCCCVTPLDEDAILICVLVALFPDTFINPVMFFAFLGINDATFNAVSDDICVVVAIVENGTASERSVWYPSAIPTKDGFSLGTTKNGRPRLIPIHPRIAVIARSVKFTAPAWKIKDEWIKARRKSGHLGVRFHDLRHSAASEMTNAGIDLYTVAGVLGHKTTTSTKRYAYLVTDRLAEAVKKIGRS